MTERMNEEVNDAKNIGNVYYLDINKIYRNPLNDEIYKDDSKKDVTELRRDIKAHGLDSAITVVKDEEGNYRIVSGHGRYDAISQMYAIADPIMHNGKRVPFEKVPCDIHPPFASKEDEKAYMIACNAKKERTQVDNKSVYKTTCEIYESKVKKGEINPEEKSKKDYFIETTGLSERTFYYYEKEGNPKEEKETATKIKKVSDVQKDIDKAINIIDAIDMSEYGKTDKATIKESLDRLIKEIKSKK